MNVFICGMTRATSSTNQANSTRRQDDTAVVEPQVALVADGNTILPRSHTNLRLLSALAGVPFISPQNEVNLRIDSRTKKGLVLHCVIWLWICNSEYDVHTVTFRLLRWQRRSSVLFKRALAEPVWLLWEMNSSPQDKCREKSIVPGKGITDSNYFRH